MSWGIFFERTKSALQSARKRSVIFRRKTTYYIRLHFLKVDREFLCLLPSLARLYSAAASPSERRRGNNSLLLFYPLTSLKAQYEFWSFETGLILHRQQYSKMAERNGSLPLSHCFHNDLLLRFFDWIARIKLRFIRKSFFQVIWKKKKKRKQEGKKEIRNICGMFTVQTSNLPVPSLIPI